eukprot:GHVH01006879.1.p2 GENE.GHVH01006879.1~~GHVH01006879.1.p2  ORF type:complete len:576 (+),score=64.11 GHVH01006879.1:111-1838(+)
MTEQDNAMHYPTSAKRPDNKLFNYDIIPKVYGDHFTPPTLLPPKIQRNDKDKPTDVYCDLKNPMRVKTIDDFELENVVGYGNYCEVVIAIHRESKKTYAVKIIDKQRCQQLKHTLDVLIEKHVLCRIKDELYDPSRPDDFPFPLIYATMRGENKLYIVQEALLGGELWESIADVGCMWMPRSRSLLAQVVIAVERLHSLNIVHRDLKLENVMMRNRSQLQGRDNSIVLIDFGTSLDLSRPGLEGGGNTTRGRKGFKYHHWVGSPNFMPPEAVHNRHSDLRNDLWGLGCLVFQCLAGAPPFQAPSDYLVFIKSGYKMLEYPPGFPPLARDLIEKLLQFHPADRLGAGNEALGEAITVNWQAVKNHPFFEGIDFGSPVNEIKLVPQPVHTKLLKKLSTHVLRRLKGTEWVDDRSIEPSYAQLTDAVQDSLLIDSLNQILQDTRFCSECVQCQSSNKRRLLPPVASSVSTVLCAIVALSCDHCMSVLSSAMTENHSDVWKFISQSQRRALHHQHRVWRDRERDDGYFEILSNEYLLRNPLQKDDGSSDLSEQSPSDHELYEANIEKETDSIREKESQR